MAGPPPLTLELRLFRPEGALACEVAMSYDSSVTDLAFHAQEALELAKLPRSLVHKGRVLGTGGENGDGESLLGSLALQGVKPVIYVVPERSAAALERVPPVATEPVDEVWGDVGHEEGQGRRPPVASEQPPASRNATDGPPMGAAAHDPVDAMPTEGAAAPADADATPLAAGEAEDEAPPVCRICYSGPEVFDPLFRPCLCRGTIAYVHPSCLDHWRVAATRVDAFQRCDMCGFEYRVRTTRLQIVTRILQKEVAAAVSVLLFFIMALVAGGFFRYVCLGTLQDWGYVSRRFRIHRFLRIPPWWRTRRDEDLSVRYAYFSMDTLLMGITFLGLIGFVVYCYFEGGVALQLLMGAQQNGRINFERLIGGSMFFFWLLHESQSHNAMRVFVGLGTTVGVYGMIAELQRAGRYVVQRFGQRVLAFDAPEAEGDTGTGSVIFAT